MNIKDKLFYFPLETTKKLDSKCIKKKQKNLGKVKKYIEKKIYEEFPSKQEKNKNINYYKLPFKNTIKSEMNSIGVF